ncbi:MAG: DUF84 family protein [Clostridia bacterium]
MNMHWSTDGTCDFGVGIEAGMFPVEEANTGYMDCDICSIYDGENYYIGFGPCFEYPKLAVEKSLKGEEIGYMIDVFGKETKGREGVIGILSDGRVYRDSLEESAVNMALIQIISKEIYNKR